LRFPREPLEQLCGISAVEDVWDEFCPSSEAKLEVLRWLDEHDPGLLDMAFVGDMVMLGLQIPGDLGEVTLSVGEGSLRRTGCGDLWDRSEGFRTRVAGRTLLDDVDDEPSFSPPDGARLSVCGLVRSFLLFSLASRMRTRSRLMRSVDSCQAACQRSLSRLTADGPSLAKPSSVGLAGG